MRFADLVLSNVSLTNTISDNRRSISHQVMLEEVLRLKHSLASMGVKNNDTVGVMYGNQIEFIISVLAINLLDAYVMPIYRTMGNEKLKQVIIHYGVEYIISSSNNSYCQIQEVSKVHELESGTSVYCYNSVTNNYNETQKSALLLLTSGTTTNPKCVVITNENVVTSIVDISRFLELSSRDKILVLKNVVHVSTLIGELLVGLYCGCNIYMTDRLIVGSYIERIICKHNVTTLFLTPTIIRDILPSLNKSLQNLRMIHLCGEMLPPELVNQIHEQIPNARLCSGYGLTEASPRVTQIDIEDMLTHPRSVGKPIGTQCVKVIDKKGNRCTNHVRGEILVKGKNIMKGYLYDGKLLSPPNGWLYTGDIGYIDEEGFLYVEGRKDNMFIVKGRNIQPEEIERVIETHPKVKEVLVKEDFVNGKNFVLAEIVANSQLTASEICKYCKLYLEDYKIPTKIKIVENISKTLTGKKNRIK